MEKYGVDTEEEPKKASEDAERVCPECGSTLLAGGNVPRCPKCGTKPFEKKDP